MTKVNGTSNTEQTTGTPEEEAKKAFDYIDGADGSQDGVINNTEALDAILKLGIGDPAQTKEEKKYITNLGATLTKDGSMTYEEFALFQNAVEAANKTDITKLKNKADLIDIFPEEFQDKVGTLFNNLKPEKRKDLLRIMTADNLSNTDGEHPLLDLQSALKMIGVNEPKWLSDALSPAPTPTPITENPQNDIQTLIEELNLPDEVETLLKNFLTKLPPELQELLIIKIRTSAEFLEDLTAAATGDDPVLSVIGVIDTALENKVNLTVDYIKSLNLDEKVKEILTNLAAAGTKITTAIIENLTLVWNEVKDVAVPIKDAILTGIQNAGKNIDAFLGKLKEATQAEDPIVAILQVLDDTVENIAGAVVAYVESLPITEDVKKILKAMGQAAENAGEAIGDFIDKIPSIIDKLQGLGADALEFINGVIDTVGSSKPAQWVEGLIDAMKNGGNPVIDGLVYVANSIGTGLENLSDKLPDLKDVIDAIQQGGQAVVDAIQQGGQAVIDAIKEGGQAVVDAIKEGGQAVVDAIQQGGQAVIDAIKEGGTKVVELIKAGVKITAETAEFFAVSGEYVIDFFLDVILGKNDANGKREGGLKDLGADFIKGLVTAMQNGDNPVIDGALYLLKSLDDNLGNEQQSKIKEIVESALRELRIKDNINFQEYTNDIKAILKDLRTKGIIGFDDIKKMIGGLGEDMQTFFDDKGNGKIGDKFKRQK